jgi:hypothetical protein
MSRHEIPGFSPANKVIVGWDNPMQTFFMQVIDRKKENAGKDEKFVSWRGTALREIYEVEDLRRRLSPYADLTRKMGSALYGDKDEGL